MTRKDDRPDNSEFSAYHDSHVIIEVAVQVNYLHYVGIYLISQSLPYILII